MAQNLVIVAEHFQGELAPVTYELVAFAEAMQALMPMDYRAVILGDAVEGLARELSEETGTEVIAVQSPQLALYNAEAYKEALTQVISEIRPAYVAVGHTTQGWDYAPGLAVSLAAVCITGVEGVRMEGEIPVFTRSVMNGKFVTEIKPNSPLTILTVQTGAFRASPRKNPPVGSVNRVNASFKMETSRTLGFKQTQEESASLTEADVIVAAGRGIGKEANLDLVEQLAGLFPKSAVAGSRPVCDSGWLEYKQQVGLTGATVSPRLYIACGISGASQHIAGMKGAEFIVAINTDPHAAIFNVADVCVVEDLKTFIPVLIQAHQESRT
jgi:electron transfer flavoprotein alpha subunit